MVLKKNKQLLSNLGGIEYKIIQGNKIIKSFNYIQDYKIFI